jgi:hypothetical protein
VAQSRHDGLHRTRPLFQEQSEHDRLRQFAFTVAILGKADVPFCTAYVR